MTTVAIASTAGVHALLFRRVSSREVARCKIGVARMGCSTKLQTNWAEYGGYGKRRNAARRGVYFKHALVHDAAYGTLLRSRRQQLHARIASMLESQFPDVVETQPELLGRHFAEGASRRTRSLPSQENGRLSAVPMQSGPTFSPRAGAVARTIGNRRAQQSGAQDAGKDRPSTPADARFRCGGSRENILTGA
jgi:hypothetical protein